MAILAPADLDAAQAINRRIRLPHDDSIPRRHAVNVAPPYFMKMVNTVAAQDRRSVV